MTRLVPTERCAVCDRLFYDEYALDAHKDRHWHHECGGCYSLFALDFLVQEHKPHCKATKATSCTDPWLPPVRRKNALAPSAAMSISFASSPHRQLSLDRWYASSRTRETVPTLVGVPPLADPLPRFRPFAPTVPSSATPSALSVSTAPASSTSAPVTLARVDREPMMESAPVS